MKNIKKLSILLSFCFVAIHGSGQPSKLERLTKEVQDTYAEFSKALSAHSAYQKQFDDFSAKQDYSAESQDKLLKLDGPLQEAKNKKNEAQIKHLQAVTALQKEQLDQCRQENARLLAEHKAEIEKLLKEKSFTAGLHAQKQTLEKEISDLEKEAVDLKVGDLFSARKPKEPGYYTAADKAKSDMERELAAAAKAKSDIEKIKSDFKQEIENLERKKDQLEDEIRELEDDKQCLEAALAKKESAAA